MFHIKYFETEEEMQACDDKHQYVAYIENGIKANIHREVPFFCILRLKDGSTVELPPMAFISRDGDKDFGIPAPKA